MDVHYLPGYPIASSSTSCFTPELPAEIWAHIFHLATDDPVHMSTTHVPFASHSAPFIDLDLLQIKAAIVLVCRRWRALGLRSLYEMIRIPTRQPHPVFGLLEGLRRVERFSTEPNGCCVRRIILSSTRVDFDLEVLKCCPYIEVVIKPVPEICDDGSRIQRFPFPDPSILSFDLLQRIEWSFPSAYRIYHMNLYFAQESLTVLWHIIQLAPNLRYLSLTGETPWLLHHSHIFSDLREQMQGLRVLRTHYLTSGLVEGITKWCLPNLTHLITDSTPLLQTIQAPHVRVVDLLGKGIPDENLHHTLTSFPELEELCYMLGCTEVPPSSDIILSPNFHCVRVRKRYHFTNTDFVNHHLEWLCGPTPLSLKQVVLYGNWKRRPDQMLIQQWIPRFAAKHCSLRKA